ncbi:MAG TPA: ABC transporter permease, partial [Terriglobia bacterium]|nr:ABC transporter permease [Terriglobia bacterium]
MRTLSHSLYMTVRHFRALMRQPVYIAFTLVQPIIWLVLFGQLFKNIVLLPGFGASAYVDFLTPGVVIMTVLFGAGWSGMGVIRDLDHGVMDRFLVSPASRVALIAGRLIQLATVAVIQSVLIVVLGLIMGARFPGGIAGVILLIICAVLLAVPIGALSCAMALVARKEETVIAASNFILLPLTFLSSVFMAANLMPDWIQAVAHFNPVEWAVVAGRSA